MGAPVGNQNAARAKQWQAAIERAIERLADPSIDPDSPVPRTPRVKGLDMLADAFVASVKASNYKAFSELGDRIDGKPSQSHEVSGPGGDPIETSIQVRFGNGSG